MFEPQEGMTVQELLDWTRYAEDAGFGYVFRSDHILPTSGRGGLACPECWVSLAAMASATKRVRFGPLVSPIGFRNPALLARMACTVHSLSGGRLQMAVGAGWYKDEYDAHGMEFPGASVRQAQLREALQIIAPLIRGFEVNFSGEHFNAHTAVIPKPAEPMHLIVGGKSRRSVSSAAEFADEWNVFSPSMQEFARLKAVLDSTGRRVEVSQMAPFLIAENREQLEECAKRLMRQSGSGGSVETFLKSLREETGVIAGVVGDFIAQVNERLDAGIEKFYFQVRDTNDRGPVDLLCRTLRTEF